MLKSLKPLISRVGIAANSDSSLAFGNVIENITLPIGAGIKRVRPLVLKLSESHSFCLSASLWRCIHLDLH